VLPLAFSYFCYVFNGEFKFTSLSYRFFVSKALPFPQELKVFKLKYFQRHAEDGRVRRADVEDDDPGL
jgi:hypothetical protein